MLPASGDTAYLQTLGSSTTEGFQSIGVTSEWRLPVAACRCPCAICFQSIGVTSEWRLFSLFLALLFSYTSFQSIGVTSEWRLQRLPCSTAATVSSFQSIGVTSEWRLLFTFMNALMDSQVSFQSIGVTSEWRLTEKERWDDEACRKVSNQ